MGSVKYYAKYNNSGSLLAIGIGVGGTEITKEQYESYLSEIREKVKLVNELYSGEITIEKVPVAWREEIQRRVDERFAAQSVVVEQDISAEEALNIILGGEDA